MRPIRIQVIVLVILLAGQASCRTETAPQRSFDSSDLLLTLDDLPENYRVADLPQPMGPDSPIAVGDLDDSYVTFHVLNDVHLAAIDRVYRFSTVPKADRWYDTHLSLEFAVATRDIQWSLPSNLTYRSPYTDRFRLGCTLVGIDRQKVCKFMAQYEEFVVVFHSTIAEDLMTVSQFNDTVRHIDEKLAEFLELYPLNESNNWTSPEKVESRRRRYT